MLPLTAPNPELDRRSADAGRDDVLVRDLRRSSGNLRRLQALRLQRRRPHQAGNVVTRARSL